MKLLMITRKVDRDDWLAGFTYNWVKRIGERTEKLMVICLEQGNISGLPEQVQIFSLGKEKHNSRWQRFCNFQKLAWHLAPQAEGIFCHMNPEYTLAIWPYAKIFGKKIVSWYAHGAVTWKTRALTFLANRIITPSKESFRLPSPKVKILGHGIDLDVFQSAPTAGDIKRIISVGRISPTKNYQILIQAINELKKRGQADWRLDIIGAAGLPEQQKYQQSLKELAEKLDLSDTIDFLGAVPNRELVKYYQRAGIFVNLSGTGSVDKAVLEAMACGCLVVTSNEAFKNILPVELLVEPAADKVADKLNELSGFSLSAKQELINRLIAEVKNNHDLNQLAERIIKTFHEI